jgi:hypothetical protein
MTYLKLTSVIVAGLVLPTALFAGDTALDADGDGAVTMSEFNEAMPEAGVAVFAEIDADANGILDAEEIATARDVGMLPATSSES